MDERIENYLTIFISYLLYTESYNLYKLIKKFLNKLSFFENKGDSDYLIIKGNAEKFFTISGELFNNTIIELSQHTHYHEDFLLSGSLIQPYEKTHYLLRPKLNNTNFFTKFISWLFPVYVLSHRDEVLVYGKVERNENFLMNDYNNYTTVKAKLMAHNMEEGQMLRYIQKQEAAKLTFQVLKIAIYGSVLYLLARHSVYPKFKRLLKLFRYKAQVHCSNCKIKLCNLLCEKCEYLTNYCDGCYINFQNKINSSEIVLENIRCGNCNAVLDRVQKLLLENI
jgi:hypothetical protein